MEIVPLVAVGMFTYQARQAKKEQGIPFETRSLT
jgi:hypothetical protein